MRARAIGIPFPGQTGKWNAITDVEGVEVGYETIIEGSGPLVIGEGPVRTGVTAIFPKGKEAPLSPVWAGVHSFNGNGVMTGTQWIEDGGYFTSPVVLTNSHGIGMAHHATTKWMFERYQAAYTKEHLWSMPVIAETYDGVTNDIHGMHVTEEHVFRALNRASSGPIAEGNVGGGTGMITYDFKGGSGTSSRVVTVDGKTYTVGVFVQSNFGRRPWLQIAGVPVGEEMPKDVVKEDDRGSIIVVIATDAPLLPHQLRRLAKRATLGIARTGTVGGNGSGDIFLAFSTANEQEVPQVASSHQTYRAINDEYCDPLYEGVVWATEEAIINAMTSGESMRAVKPEGVIPAINLVALREVMKKYNRLQKEGE